MGYETSATWGAIDELGTKPAGEHLKDLGIPLDEYEQFVKLFLGWQNMASKPPFEVVATAILLGLLLRPRLTDA